MLAAFVDNNENKTKLHIDEKENTENPKVHRKKDILFFVPSISLNCILLVLCYSSFWKVSGAKILHRKLDMTIDFCYQNQSYLRDSNCSNNKGKDKGKDKGKGNGKGKPGKDNCEEDEEEEEEEKESGCLCCKKKKKETTLSEGDTPKGAPQLPKDHHHHKHRHSHPHPNQYDQYPPVCPTPRHQNVTTDAQPIPIPSVPLDITCEEQPAQYQSPMGSPKSSHSSPRQLYSAESPRPQHPQQPPQPPPSSPRPSQPPPQRTSQPHPILTSSKPPRHSQPQAAPPPPQRAPPPPQHYAPPPQPPPCVPPPQPCAPPQQRQYAVDQYSSQSAPCRQSYGGSTLTATTDQSQEQTESEPKKAGCCSAKKGKNNKASIHAMVQGYKVSGHIRVKGKNYPEVVSLPTDTYLCTQ